MVSGIVITVIACVVWGILITLIITDSIEFSRKFRVFAGLVLVLMFGWNSVFRVLADDAVAQLTDKVAVQEAMIAELNTRPDAKVLASADIDFGAARSIFGNPLKRDAPAEKLVAEAVVLEVHPAEGRVQHPYTFACIKVQEQNGVWTGYANDGFRYLGYTKSFVAKPTNDPPKFP